MFSKGLTSWWIVYQQRRWNKHIDGFPYQEGTRIAVPQLKMGIVGGCNVAFRSFAFSLQARHTGAAGILLSSRPDSNTEPHQLWPSCTSRSRNYSNDPSEHKPLLEADKRKAEQSKVFSKTRRPPKLNLEDTQSLERTGRSHDKQLEYAQFQLLMSRSHRQQVLWPPSDSYTQFSAIYLRDCCSCDRCVDPSTTQKTFETADIPPSIRPKSMVVQDDGSIHIAWEPDLPGFEDHVSVYDSSFGRRNNSHESRLKATSTLPYRTIMWNRNSMSQYQMNVNYNSYMTSPTTLHSCFRQLQLYGLLFIHSIPSSTDAVTRIAERIGPLKNTLYGSTWDVRSVPSAKNVAYTSSHLGFHMVRGCHLAIYNVVG